MGCALPSCGAPPCPPNAIDIVADVPGSDPTHSTFDVVAKGMFMPEQLRPFLSEKEYEDVMTEVNTVIKSRTRSEECCPPKPGLLALWCLLIVTIFAALDWIIARSIRKLDKCQEKVKPWEEKGLVVRFYKGVPSLKPPLQNNLIRVHIPPGR